MGKGPWASNQTVAATFQSACPRNSLGRRGSFLTVERLADGCSTGWEVVRLLQFKPLTKNTSVNSSSVWRWDVAPTAPAPDGKL